MTMNNGSHATPKNQKAPNDKAVTKGPAPKTTPPVVDTIVTLHKKPSEVDRAANHNDLQSLNESGAAADFTLGAEWSSFIDAEALLRNDK